MAQATAPIQKIVAGNTLPAKNFTFTVNAAPLTIDSATFAIRNKKSGARVLEPTACTISGAADNIVTRPVVVAADTAGWYPGGESGLFPTNPNWEPEYLVWDIEITFSGTVEKTWVKGEFEVLPTAQ